MQTTFLKIIAIHTTRDDENTVVSMPSHKLAMYCHHSAHAQVKTRVFPY